MELSDYMNQLERGGKAALARKIGAHAPDLSDWIAGRRKVPPKHCVAIELATAGVVTRRELRPKDWQDIWPELVSTPGEA